jgi:predicted nucleic acid-binding protein
MRGLAIDTGPLVAFLNARDAFHRWAIETFGEIEPPLQTCESVISEACFLVRDLKGGPDAVLSMVSRRLVAVSFHLDAEIDPVRRLVAKYASVPMSVADACLVRMTELDSELSVITLDRDFRVYRRHGRQTVPVITP